MLPSTYFIGQSGFPLEIVLGSVDANSLVAKLKKAADAHSNEVITSTTTQSVNTDQQNSMRESIVSDMAPVVDTSAVNSASNAQTVSADTTATVRAAVASAVDASDEETTGTPSAKKSTAKPSVDERVASAKQKLADLRKEREAQKAEDEKQRELNRRQVGRDIAKAKQERVEQRAKQLAEERRKEKARDLQARESVRAQIAKDKEEKSSQYKKEKAERDARIEAKKAEKAAAKEEEIKLLRENTRIQFRLPDGSSFSHVFQSAQTLGELRELVTNHVGSKYGTFSLVATYPRRDLTPDYDSNSLLDLNLAPSGVVMVTTSGKNWLGGQSPSGSSLGNTAWEMLLLPFTIIWSLITFVLSLFTSNLQSSGSSGSNQSTTGSQSGRTSSEPSGVRQRWRSEQEGNVHRMKTEDDDGENNTWNGNSTQQQ